MRRWAALIRGKKLASGRQSDNDIIGTRQAVTKDACPGRMPIWQKPGQFTVSRSDKQPST